MACVCSATRKGGLALFDKSLRRLAIIRTRHRAIDLGANLSLVHGGGTGCERLKQKFMTGNRERRILRDLICQCARRPDGIRGHYVNQSHPGALFDGERTAAIEYPLR